VSTALERLLTTLSSVERLMPLADNVFVVAPESHVRSLSLSLVTKGGHFDVSLHKSCIPTRVWAS